METQVEVSQGMHGDKVGINSFAELIRFAFDFFAGDTPADPPMGHVFRGLIQEYVTWSQREQPVRISPALHKTAFATHKDVLGIDISSHQGKVNLEPYDDTPFVIIKATEGGKDKEGEGFVDPRFAENKAKVIEAGKIWSAYHFARVSEKSFAGEKGVEKDGINEAQWFLDQYGREVKPGMLPPVLDIEWDKRATKAGITAQQVVQFCEAFVGTIKDELGVWPMVYTGPNFWKYRLRKTLVLSQCPLWIVAGYTGKYARPSKPIPGWDWVIHQYTNKRSRPDAKGKGVDGNYFRGTMAELRAMASIPENAVPDEAPKLVA